MLTNSHSIPIYCANWTAMLADSLGSYCEIGRSKSHTYGELDTAHNLPFLLFLKSASK